MIAQFGRLTPSDGIGLTRRAMKFVEDRPYSKPEAAARLLVELIERETASSGYAHAYTGSINHAFTRSGGSIAEYAIGRDFGIEAGLFTVDDSGSRIKLGRHADGWKRPPGY